MRFFLLLFYFSLPSYAETNDIIIHYTSYFRFFSYFRLRLVWFWGFTNTFISRFWWKIKKLKLKCLISPRLYGILLNTVFTDGLIPPGATVLKFAPAGYRLAKLSVKGSKIKKLSPILFVIQAKIVYLNIFLYVNKLFFFLWNQRIQMLFSHARDANFSIAGNSSILRRYK